MTKVWERAQRRLIGQRREARLMRQARSTRSRGIACLGTGLVLLSCTTLSGCAWTLITAADAAGSVTQAGFAVASNYASPTYVTGQPAKVHTVCIELNNGVPDENLAPALRVALSSYGVRSQVYNVGTAPPDCEAKLTYTATLDYGHREFSNGYTRYLSSLDLRLTHGGDVIVAHYQTEGLNLDRFTTTSTKLASLMKRVIAPPSAADTRLADASMQGTPGTSAYAISTTGNSTYVTTSAVPTSPNYATRLPGTGAAGSADPYNNGAGLPYNNGSGLQQYGSGSPTPQNPAMLRQSGY